MKLLTSLLFLILVQNTWADANDSRMMRMATKALMSYPMVKRTTRNFVEVVQNKTLGDDVVYVGYLVPFIRGEISYQKRDINVFYNFREQSAGARYTFNF